MDLKRVLPSFRYVGLDIKEPCDVKCDLRQNRLPFKDQAFDLIVATEVLEHLGHLHFPTLKQIRDFASSQFKIEKEVPYFESYFQKNKLLAIVLELLINLLCKLRPSLFAKYLILRCRK
jgi:hypothetical protein